MNVREYPTGEDTEGIFDLGLISEKPDDFSLSSRSNDLSDLKKFKRDHMGRLKIFDRDCKRGYPPQVFSGSESTALTFFSGR
ncbi:MAG: hypothetical protein ABSG49_09530 [Methanoregula sp.]|jgi:hypothetical protein|uniref:hypothetical protein n=1 Tax=Methanoregula sp. TaxID=2052170 RepID=UPI003C25D540